MIVTSYQTAFHRVSRGEVRVRRIEIGEPAADRLSLLEQAFHYGQNDVQPVDGCYSVSVGDVIELPDGSLHRVQGHGFVRLPAGEAATAKVGDAAQEAGRGW